MAINTTALQSDIDGGFDALGILMTAVTDFFFEHMLGFIIVMGIIGVIVSIIVLIIAFVRNLFKSNMSNMNMN